MRRLFLLLSITLLAGCSHFHPGYYPAVTPLPPPPAYNPVHLPGSPDLI
ncbi:MAG: hypothetical protein JOY71_14080 [Acetobacteraceae bacterium]|nr:hypothetical protein [Acetobacteraceae bacterium]